jgi:hypothetical protein
MTEEKEEPARLSGPEVGEIVARFLRAREAEAGIDAACLDASILIGRSLRYVLDVTTPADAFMLLASAEVELSAAVTRETPRRRRFHIVGEAETPPAGKAN